MKPYLLSLYCLITLHTLSAMENNHKEITILNRNISEVRISSQSFNISDQKFRECNGLVAKLESHQEKTLALTEIASIGPKEKVYVIPTLEIPNCASNITLNISDNGALSYGDTITIMQDNTAIFIKNSSKHILAKLQRTDIPLFIGTDPGNFPIHPITKQKIKIFNKNLMQVLLYNVAYCLSSINPNELSGSNNPFPIFYSYQQKKCEKNDVILQKNKRCIQKAELRKIKLFSLTDARIYLRIPQAAQKKVCINVNQGEIQSGDTLEVSLSEETNTIHITNHRTNNILAILHSNNRKLNTIVLG